MVTVSVCHFLLPLSAPSNPCAPARAGVCNARARAISERRAGLRTGCGIQAHAHGGR